MIKYAKAQIHKEDEKTIAISYFTAKNFWHTLCRRIKYAGINQSYINRFEAKIQAWYGALCLYLVFAQMNKYANVHIFTTRKQ